MKVQNLDESTKSEMLEVFGAAMSDYTHEILLIVAVSFEAYGVLSSFLGKSVLELDIFRFWCNHEICGTYRKISIPEYQNMLAVVRPC